MAKFIVGLTGGIGSGKTTVTTMFEELGVNVVDADLVARQVVTPGSTALKAIKKRFGDNYLNEDGQLNRALLRERIFNNNEDKTWLNSLMHPLINDEMHRQLSATTSTYCILVAPLLLENKLYEKTDTVLVVNVSPEDQIKRTVKRDGSNEALVKSIIASQISQKNRLALANDIIDNSASDLSKIKEQVKQLHHKYLSFSEQIHKR
jgi:dephospho-CoA kinase